MRERLLAFVHALRSRDVRISVAESLDALAAVAVAGVDRAVLREALAATLVKDERDRPAFDPLFEAHFPLAGPGDAEGRRRRRAGAAGAAGGRGGAAGSAGMPAAATKRADASSPTRPRPASREPQDDDPGTRAREDARPGHDDEARASERRGRAARRRELLTRPFEAFTSRDVEEARDVVRELAMRLRARLARRERSARRGRIDLRRTLRAATASGGVPVRLERRSRRPGRPDLIVLCDLSGSVATASELCLGLVAPAARHFRRVHLFAYVDQLCAISIEQGHVAPGGPLDLHARSDFGRVLVDLWRDRADVLRRNALLLVLGDARNNRRPPRADLLRAARERVGRLVWLVPERHERWNTGDSVLDRYAPVCDAVVECTDLTMLAAAVRHLF